MGDLGDWVEAICAVTVLFVVLLGIIVGLVAIGDLIL